VAISATAFSHRGALADMLLVGHWDDPAYNEQGRAMLRANWDKLAPYTEGYYVNLNDADPKGTDRNYGSNFRRLSEVKRRFDPLNLFRLNANIKPA
jgi:FAD/FMN-containing dehydrogenase